MNNYDLGIASIGIILLLSLFGTGIYIMVQADNINNFCEDASYKECYNYCEERELFNCLKIVENLIAKDKILGIIEDE